VAVNMFRASCVVRDLIELSVPCATMRI